MKKKKKWNFLFHFSTDFKKKKASLHFGLLTGGEGGGTKRPFRGLSPLFCGGVHLEIFFWC